MFLSLTIASLGRKEEAQIWKVFAWSSKCQMYFTWQWGCGFEQPMAAPLFSKIWTHLTVWKFEQSINCLLCFTKYLSVPIWMDINRCSNMANQHRFSPNQMKSICKTRPPTCTSGPAWSSRPPRCQSPPWSRAGSSEAGSRSTLGWSTSPCMCLVLRQTWKTVVYHLQDFLLFGEQREKIKPTWREDRQYLLAQERPQAVQGSHCWKQMLTHTYTIL